MRALLALGLSLSPTPLLAEPHGLAVGAELGQPVAATAGFFGRQFAVAGGLGTGTLSGAGFEAHVEALVLPARLASRLPVYLGLGMRWYHHDAAMSIDELSDSHIGIRAIVQVAYELGSMQLYAELAPGVDVHRTASCTLGSGVDSVCPHAMERPLFLDFAVGGRWFFGR